MMPRRPISFRLSHEDLIWLGRHGRSLAKQLRQDMRLLQRLLHVADRQAHLAIGDALDLIILPEGGAEEDAKEQATDGPMPIQEAVEYVQTHGDDDVDPDNLDEVFEALYGELPNEQDRKDGVWSLCCAHPDVLR